MIFDYDAYPYPVCSMTLNRYDDKTIKISKEFIEDFIKEQPYTITTHDDIQTGRVKKENLIGHCVFCSSISKISNSMLNYQDKDFKNYTYCVCSDCVKKYDENLK